MAALLTQNLPLKIVGDNIDKSVRPREETSEEHTKSLHYFHTYAVKDRTDASALEDNAHLSDLEGADVSEVLPSDDDLRILKQNMSVIAGKCIHYSCHCILIKFLCRKDYSEVLSVF